MLDSTPPALLAAVAETPFGQRLQYHGAASSLTRDIRAGEEPLSPVWLQPSGTTAGGSRLHALLDQRRVVLA